MKGVYEIDYFLDNFLHPSSPIFFTVHPNQTSESTNMEKRLHREKKLTEESLTKIHFCFALSLNNNRQFIKEK